MARAASIAPLAMKCHGDASSLDNERNSFSPCSRGEDVLHVVTLIDGSFETLLPSNFPLPMMEGIRILIYAGYRRMLHKVAVITEKAGNEFRIDKDEV
jgi:hypothetical protein